MSANKYFGLFLWINDNQVTGNVANLTNIVEPRKPMADYKEKDVVKARCKGYGIQTGVLGRITDESGKKALGDILNGNEFKEMVKDWQASVIQTGLGQDEKVDEPLILETTENRKRKHSPTVLPPMPSDDVNTEIDDVEMIDDLEIEKNVPKKKSAKKNLPEEAQAAKQEAAKLKRQKVKVMAEASSVMSLDVLHADSITAERNQTAIDIATINADLKTVADNQEKLIALIEPLLESVQCNQCLKSMYKGIKRSSLKSKSQSPSQSVSQSVLQSPSQGVSRAPLQSVSQTPSQSISRAPLQSVSQTPSQSMSRAPLQSVSQSPSQAEAVSRAPLQSVLQAPLPSQSPLQSVSKSPSQSLGKDLEVFDMSILEENDVGALMTWQAAPKKEGPTRRTN